ncbi:MAG: acetyl-CoA carboxylase carboxyltransferase subunit beta [Planctomycetota bacterium]|nr:MAG: acetyl-CoA carboxylase carboxyltransferase subunit beta [Planctomycetota bacterium]
MVWKRIKKFAFSRKKSVPEGLWMRCPGCEKMVYKKMVEEGQMVCPECNFHFEIGARERVSLIVDEGKFEELFSDLESVDPLHFSGKKAYKDRLSVAQEVTGLKEACIIGRGEIEGKPVVFGVTDSKFMRGSMGSVVGEKITRGIETAVQDDRPFVFVSGSGGGARMDEGMFSLIQMAKTSAALARLHETGLVYITVLTHPTMGGAMASFAALGDLLIAEPGAHIGFAGPRVIKETVGKDLPAGFQKSEFLLEHGLIDMIVNRPELKATIARLLDYLQKQPDESA